MSADVLKDEGLHLFQAGDYEGALVKFETAVSLYAADANEAGRAEMWNNMGVIHRLRGQRDAALAVLTQAADAFAQLGDDNRQAQALGNLGDLYAAAKDQTEAARCYSDAAALFAQDGDRDKQSQVLRALSLMRLRQGRFVQAMMHMEESLTVKPHAGFFGGIFRGMLRFVLKLMGAK
ncbi:MAG: tetratricopeptide repeat protein [Ardenticatenaceae bacterium]|nr:tetratricopeptide repeat protein [Ardenticatenaceae bacterium]MCB8989950.1 tetratricopeptide repeat protein [Ardenticatenaceae bacterium]MCB9005393.1 tetratricopeptide repeat protein [Ardenticatenaceae bacterium]